MQSPPTFASLRSKTFMQKDKASCLIWFGPWDSPGGEPFWNRMVSVLPSLSPGGSAALCPRLGLRRSDNPISHLQPGERDEVSRSFCSCRKPEKINLWTERWHQAVEEIYDGEKSRPRSLVFVSLYLSSDYRRVLWLEEISRGHVIQPPAS